MTVGELIKELSEYDLEYEVLYYDFKAGDYYPDSINVVYEVRDTKGQKKVIVKR